MPPAAALECDRTGCTLLMIATVAPASAAASAARCPARPAPMMRTSCAGMVGESIERGGQSVYGGASGPGPRETPQTLARILPHPMAPVRTLIVDDHADVRFLIRAIMEDAAEEVEVVAEADGVESALAPLGEAAPRGGG